MSEHHTERTLAEHQVHIQYIGRGQRTIESRLRTVEDTQRHHTFQLASQPDTAKRLRQVEEGVRLIKAAGGLVMLALAASGQVGGLGEKAARMLLGLP